MDHAFGFRGIGSVSATSRVVLSAWRIIQLKDGGVHFAGYNEALRTPTVSSRVTEFNPTALTGTTESGRLYHLIAQSDPVDTKLTERVSMGILGWMASYGDTTYTDITSSLMEVTKTAVVAAPD